MFAFGGLTAHKQVGPGTALETPPSRKAGRLYSKTDTRARELSADRPDFGPAAKVALLKASGCLPSADVIGGGDDGTPIGAPVHGRSDADGLPGCACNQDLEPVANLKISAGRAARVNKPY